MRAHIHKISKYAPSIFQGRLDFSSARGGISLTLEHPAERLALRILVLALVFVMCAYFYFIAASILNVIARKEALTKVTMIQGSIGGREQQYFELTKGITPQDGPELGLTPVAKKAYVYRPGNVGAATIARNEI